MEHSFNVEVAKKYGVNAAVLLNNLNFWIAKNKANNTNYYDGYYWTYNSKNAFAELFPYMNARQIDYALKKLIDDGAVITGNYNKVAYDRTLWYAITKKGYCILQNCEMEETKLLDGTTNIVEPIPNINSNTKTKDNKQNIEVLQSNNKVTRFSKPTIQEISSYCEERNNGIDPQHFFDYYESNGWVVGKNKMKDWKATIRNWERRNNSKQTKQSEFSDVAVKIQERAKASTITEEDFNNLNF